MSDKKIVVCDDDTAIVEVIAIVLEEKGYTVFALTNPREVMATIEREKPDLVLLDLWMPGIGGDKLARMIRQNAETTDLPVILISANKNTPQIAEEVEATDYISKPFDIEELEQKVESTFS